MKEKQNFTGWFKLGFEFDSRIKVELALQSFLGRKHQGLYAIFCPIEPAFREKTFYFAIEGIEFYNMLIKLFPLLKPCEPPSKEKVIRVLGSARERDWMFNIPIITTEPHYAETKSISRKVRYLNLALQGGNNFDKEE
ncbi:MAG: hypothetical protein H7Y13_06670 [Sphingobacteriaceae bacterium]|nr:hypothetical protein [Sphingobacteriaceae bacterium]